jgi:DNA-binding winged helix-turn-helix (wHTH) protein
VRIQFGSFVLDRDTRQLTRDSEELHLTPKALQLLTLLVEERPKVVAKAVLLERLWPDTFVAEANLSNLVTEIRDALGDRTRRPKWIRTAHGFGYAFCGDAVATNPAAVAIDASLCWLEWGRERFPLTAGEHVIGREPDVEIRLDAPTVSRRHARLVVSLDGAWLEDFGSKNGTQRGDERITTPVQLADGDIVHIGALMLTFHTNALASTDTLVRTR